MNRSHAMRLTLFIAALGASSAAHATQCFSMFDGKNGLVYQSTTTPINLSGSIADQMTRRFPSRYLVISDVGTCAEAGPGSGAASSNAGDDAAGGSALFGADVTSRAPIAATTNDPAPARRAVRARR